MAVEELGDYFAVKLFNPRARSRQDKFLNTPPDNRFVRLTYVIASL